MPDLSSLPVAVIGAGPVGLAAAARLLERGITPLVLERGAGAGAAILNWGHVRLFSPWRYSIDEAARALLEKTGWQAPPADTAPTGAEVVSRYLAPLAEALKPYLRFGAEVTAITRAGFDKMTSAGREAAPFLIRWRGRDGSEGAVEARAVIDVSGTWGRPNPMGIDGLPVPGEAAAADRIAYGIPDVLGSARGDYAGKRVLVVGSGHSAINAVLDLLKLQETAGGSTAWALRRNSIDKLTGGGLNDQLPERGALGLAARAAIEAGRLDLLTPFAADTIERQGDALLVRGRVDGATVTRTVDRIVVATGFRPDLDPLRELRIGLDPAVEATPALAPLIDPNLHSCGTVRPHGARELSHPEPGFYIAGSKSYGRAPTFLMLTGYEQVRSIAAAIAGDHKAAAEVHLVLPETGVCSVGNAETPAASACCGPPAAKVESSCAPKQSAAAPAATARAAGSCGAPAPKAQNACCGPAAKTADKTATDRELEAV